MSRHKLKCGFNHYDVNITVSPNRWLINISLKNCFVYCVKYLSRNARFLRWCAAHKCILVWKFIAIMARGCGCRVLSNFMPYDIYNEIKSHCSPFVYGGGQKKKVKLERLSFIPFDTIWIGWRNIYIFIFVYNEKSPNAEQIINIRSKQ